MPRCKMTSRENKKRQKRTMLFLEVLFMVVVFLISMVKVELTATWFILLSLATFRMARAISFNEIFAPVREMFTIIKRDSCGAGRNVHPKGQGSQYVIGSLIACPICTGQWSALGLYTIWALTTGNIEIVRPQFGKVLVIVLAVAAVSEILHWASEKLEWEGRQARVVAGKISPDK